MSTSTNMKLVIEMVINGAPAAASAVSAIGKKIWGILARTGHGFLTHYRNTCPWTLERPGRDFHIGE